MQADIKYPPAPSRKFHLFRYQSQDSLQKATTYV